jgi:regulator of sigma E protease
MSTVLVFLAVLGVLVVIHEFGHFAVAKLTKVSVLEFGVGFPPRLVGVRRGETLYSLNLLPFGGFVRLAGENDPRLPGSLASRSPWVRLAILAAGSGMNLLLPVLLFTAFFMIPQSVPVTDVVILGVAPGSPAEQADIRTGDLVREVDGREVKNSAELRAAVQLRLGADSRWVLERAGRELEAHLTPRVSPPEGQGAAGVSLADARVSVVSVAEGSAGQQLGLQPGDLLVAIGDYRILFAESLEETAASAEAEAPGQPVPVRVLRDGSLVELSLPPEASGFQGVELVVRPEERRSEPVWRAIPASVGQMAETMVMFRNEVSRWIGGGRPEVSGPIGIAQVTGEVARSGISPLLFWTALLSLNLAIFNLLPIPALDGGRIMFVLLELVRGGRRVPPEKEQLVHLVGFVALIALVVAVSINDVRRLIGGESLGGP